MASILLLGPYAGGVFFVAFLLTCLVMPLAACALSYRNPDQPPADCAALRHRWLALHTVRTAIAVLAFAGLSHRTDGRPAPSQRHQRGRPGELAAPSGRLTHE